MKINFKKIFVIVSILVLCLPMIQSFVPIVLEKQLKGYFETSTKPELNKQDYFSGIFQERYMKYLDDNLPLKATITRLYNQINYLLYNQTNVADLKIGKNGYFYDYPYIKEYFGQQFIGSNNVKIKIEKLTRINNYLNKLNKKLIIVFAPGKASMFPEYIPDNLKKPITDSTNYYAYKKHFQNTSLNFIDFRDYFIKYNDTSSHTIMGRLGVHWTKYAAHLAADSIIRLMENISSTDIVDKKYISIESTFEARDQDDDIAQSMNLLWNPKGDKYSYQNVEYITDNKIKPRVSVIGDSYWWTINGNGTPWNQFSEYYFMYYYKHTYDFEKELNSEVTDENLINYINNSDYVILLATEANFSWFPYGFIEHFEKVFFN